METISIQPNMTPLRDPSIFQEGDRLLYELGYKRNIDKGYGDNWIKTGRFKEITNPSEFIKQDTRMNDPDFCEHHNFMLIKLDVSPKIKTLII